jgi:hypothetical protein
MKNIWNTYILHTLKIHWRYIVYTAKMRGVYKCDYIPYLAFNLKNSSIFMWFLTVITESPCPSVSVRFRIRSGFIPCNASGYINPKPEMWYYIPCNASGYINQKYGMWHCITCLSLEQNIAIIVKSWFYYLIGSSTSNLGINSRNYTVQMSGDLFDNMFQMVE